MVPVRVVYYSLQAVKRAHSKRIYVGASTSPDCGKFDPCGGRSVTIHNTGEDCMRQIAKPYKLLVSGATTEPQKSPRRPKA